MWKYSIFVRYILRNNERHNKPIIQIILICKIVKLEKNNQPMNLPSNICFKDIFIPLFLSVLIWMIFRKIFPTSDRFFSSKHKWFSFETCCNYLEDIVLQMLLNLDRKHFTLSIHKNSCLKKRNYNFYNTFKRKGTKIEYGRKLSTRG